MTINTLHRAAKATILACSLFAALCGPAFAEVAGSGAVVAADSWSFRREVKHSKLPVVVEFWAPWCGPCKQLSPQLERLAHELRGSIKVVRVNTDESPLYTDLYHVTRLPTLLVVQSGKVVGRLEGGGDLRTLFARLEGLAAPASSAPASPAPAAVLAALTTSAGR